MRKTIAAILMGFALVSLALPASAAYSGRNHTWGKSWNWNHHATPGIFKLVSPGYEIHTDHDDVYGPCGAFFIEVEAGGKSICVFEGPQTGMSFPAEYEYVPGTPAPAHWPHRHHRHGHQPQPGPHSWPH